MFTKNRVKEVCETLAMLIISASICWFIPFAVLASPNSVGALSAPQNITAVFDEHTASRLPTFSYDDVTQGMLVYQTANGNLMPSLPVDTQVSMQVSGLTNRVSVKQVFSNHTGLVLNGRYLFPLPNEAAVDSLRLHIGERIIEGQIHPKQEAQQIFEQAKAEGKRASLVSQERPNMFTTEVANLAPNEKLVVEISYQETIKYEDGLFSLRFPLVVAPRYIPGLTLGGESGQTGRVTSSQVFDADRIIAPIRGAPSEEEPVLKADIKVNLGLGVDKAAILSPYHAITLDEQQVGLTASLANRVRADRDFVLQWRLEQGVSPVAWVFNQNGKTHQTQAASDDGSMVNTAASTSVRNIDNYSLVMVLPPKVEASGQLNLPRELILVIDTSGSMAGDSIIQAKNALRYALRGLKAQDSFNIIEFNSDVSSLSPVPLPATEENLAIARQFVNRLQADGGTEMALALNAALPRQAFNTASGADKSLRQVIFMTDGSVGNESALFELIRNQIGDNRLFTVGIGSAPNSHFMQRAAELGRGTFTYIGDVDEVEQKISQLLGKIQYPVLTDLQVRFDDGSVPDYWPAPIPDL
ncbi:MAG: marine proteobacterial sortase target protein, partial [Shewanella sp.]